MNRRRLINIVLVLVLISIYFIDCLPALTFNSSSIFIYMIKPIIYILVLLAVLKLLRFKPCAKVKYKKFIKEWTLYLSGFYILANFFAGVFLGFGKSPYSHNLKGIIENYFLLFSVLFGKEFVRSYIINSEGRKINFVKMIFITILFAIINIPLNKVLMLKGNLEIIKFIGEVLLVQLALSLMSTYLAYLGGAKLSIIYIGIIQGVQYISPILPDLNWIANAAIGTLCPIFSFMYLEYAYLKQSKQIKGRDKNNEKPSSLIISSGIFVAIVWFFIGVFPLYPKVVVTGSMEPKIHPGDMVVIRKITKSDLKVGSVVEYKKDNIYIFHRIIDIKKDKNELLYQTKGDNNTVPDKDLVKTEMIKGKVVKIVPKVGWPTLLIKDRTNKVPRKEVEF